MLSPEAAANKIATESEPFKMFRFGRIFGKPAEHYFEGEVSGARFELRRIIGYRNSFLPVVKGEIEPLPGRGALVRIKMGLHPAVWAFVGIWSAFVGFFCLAFPGMMVFTATLIEPSAGPFLLIPYGMLVFMYLLVNFGFWIEAPKQKRKLAEIFEATLQDE